MKEKIRNSLIVFFGGCALTAVCLVVGAVTDGDYRFLFLANMVTYALAGAALRKQITAISLFAALLLLSAPYGLYYATQVAFTPRIIVFPIFNLAAILFGYLSDKILDSVRAVWKMVIYISLCLFASWFFMPTVSTWVSTNETNRSGPSFEVTSLDGKNIRSDDLKGKIIVIDFWATWCAPCIAEFSALERFQHEIETREDVVLLVINEDNGGDAGLAKKFQDRRKFNLPIFVDNNASAYKAFDANAFPALYVIDRNFNIVFAKAGYNPSEDLTEILLRKIDTLNY